MLRIVDQYHSTETTLLAVTDVLVTARASSLYSVLTLLDLSAAFDMANHQLTNSRFPPWLRLAFLGLPSLGLHPILQIDLTRSLGGGLSLLLISYSQESHRALYWGLCYFPSKHNRFNYRLLYTNKKRKLIWKSFLSLTYSSRKMHCSELGKLT